MMFLDLDSFKTINDRLGHAVGDKAIKHVADWLRHSIRQNDDAIRFGGDEFIVVLRSVTSKDIERVSQCIASQIPPLRLPDENLRMTLSIGCIFYQPKRGDSTDVNWLIELADQAMYRAKRQGGSVVTIEYFNGTNGAGVSEMSY